MKLEVKKQGLCNKPLYKEHRQESLRINTINIRISEDEIEGSFGRQDKASNT